MYQPANSRTWRHAFWSLICVLSLSVSAAAGPDTKFPTPLKPEPIPSVQTLTTPYPTSYALVHDFAFGSLIDSAFNLVDTSNGRFMGMISAGNFATASLSRVREEIYIGETYYSRGTRGQRVDLVTVYDMTHLDRIAEIEIPHKRAAIVVNKAASAITESGKFLLIFNLTPATSVSIIDLDRHEFVTEVSTPGCSLVYPTIAHDFFMLCGDGAPLFVSLNDAGELQSQTKGDVFIDIDNDPLSEKASKIADTWYFVSFKGDVQPVTGKGKVGEKWSLTSKQERAENWRPAGWHWTAGHPDGRLWIGMTPKGYDGSHKDPSEEVWLFDVSTHKRLKRIPLETTGLSIDVTLDNEPQLLVLNTAGTLDVYDAQSGKYQRSIIQLGASPFQVHRLP